MQCKSDWQVICWSSNTGSTPACARLQQWQYNLSTMRVFRGNWSTRVSGFCRAWDADVRALVRLRDGAGRGVRPRRQPPPTRIQTPPRWRQLLRVVPRGWLQRRRPRLHPAGDGARLRGVGAAPRRFSVRPRRAKWLSEATQPISLPRSCDKRFACRKHWCPYLYMYNFKLYATCFN